MAKGILKYNDSEYIHRMHIVSSRKEKRHD
ncbi:Uncharacterised protein [Cedecea neteri]|uniref:Uncharacterized protein n=1 Tax=Cedecea neteri TaxID=158822 RepID=A0A2X2SYU3_9ENTR|nr:Uncharacterised protein [Cedecea neteri]